MSVDLQSAFRFWHLEENAFVRVVCPGPLLLFAGAKRKKYKREENPGADDICPNMGSFFLFPLPPPTPLDPLKLVDFTTVVGSWLLPVPGLTTARAALLPAY